jgi:hypothetical protein
MSVPSIWTITIAKSAMTRTKTARRTAIARTNATMRTVAARTNGKTAIATTMKTTGRKRPFARRAKGLSIIEPIVQAQSRNGNRFQMGLGDTSVKSNNRTIIFKKIPEGTPGLPVQQPFRRFFSWDSWLGDSGKAAI